LELFSSSAKILLATSLENPVIPAISDHLRRG
jgi:hypothetical protein